MAKARETLEKDPAFARAGAGGPGEEDRRPRPRRTCWRCGSEAVAKDAKLTELGELQRAAQWRLDYVAAENSMGFHAPQEMARILGESIDLSRQAEVKAAVLLGGKPPEVQPPHPVPGPEKAAR